MRYFNGPPIFGEKNGENLTRIGGGANIFVMAILEERLPKFWPSLSSQIPLFQEHFWRRGHKLASHHRLRRAIKQQKSLTNGILLSLLLGRRLKKGPRAFFIFFLFFVENGAHPPSGVEEKMWMDGWLRRQIPSRPFFLAIPFCRSSFYP
jgi:hypothetical protein